ncbi:MAG: hypothetical protein R2715_09550 [Ilumatobacteraceae bacterium]
MPRRNRLLSPSIYLQRNGLYKGVLGGNKGWLTVFVLLWGRKKAKSAFGKSESYVTTEKLEPGQYVMLQTIAAPKRREVKRAKRDDKAAAKLADQQAVAAKAAAKAADKAAKQSAKATRSGRRDRRVEV